MRLRLWLRSRRRCKSMHEDHYHGWVRCQLRVGHDDYLHRCILIGGFIRQAWKHDIGWPNEKYPHELPPEWI